jgi:hypothetical protein
MSGEEKTSEEEVGDKEGLFLSGIWKALNTHLEDESCVEIEIRRACVARFREAYKSQGGLLVEDFRNEGVGEEEDREEDNRKENNRKDNNSSAIETERTSARANIANKGKRELQTATSTKGAAHKKPKTVTRQAGNAKEVRRSIGNLEKSRKRSAGQDKKGKMEAYSGIKLIEGKGGINLKAIRGFLRDLRENCFYTSKMKWKDKSYVLYDWIEAHLQGKYRFKVCKKDVEKRGFPKVEDRCFGKVPFLLLPPNDWPQFEPHRTLVTSRGKPNVTLGRNLELTANPCDGKSPNFIVTGQSLFNYIDWLGNLLNARGVGEVRIK